MNTTFTFKTLTKCRHEYIKFDHYLYDSKGKVICKVYICPDCKHVDYRIW
jgi:hypothetical protein